MQQATLVPIDILLVEDSPADVRLTQEALRGAKVMNNLHVVGDGVDAVAYLRRQREFADAPTPHLILLDLNLPRMDGRQVLSEIKNDPHLKHIPVVILTTSEADQDIAASYGLHANCYVIKPVGLSEFITIIRSIQSFWLSVVTLPTVVTDTPAS